MSEAFRKFSQLVAGWVGSPVTFIAALLLIVGWAVSGPVFNFSDTWQLVINTTTTIITFLMVFIIQNTQNRDAKAIHLKLDELISASHNARDFMVSLEQLSDEELAALQKQFEKIGNNPKEISRLARELAKEVQEEDTATKKNGQTDPGGG